MKIDRQASTLHKRGSSFSSLGTCLLLALAAGIAWASEASLVVPVEPDEPSAPHAGLDAVPSLPGGPGDSPPLISLRSREETDTDGDGVPGGLGRSTETSLEDPSDGAGLSAVRRGEPMLPTIRFGFGSIFLDPASVSALNEVANLLKENAEIILEVGGHTDNQGPARLNQKISLDRAEAVKAYLVSRGVPASRLITKGYGKIHPIASNRDAAGRARNRRVEFKVVLP